MLVMALTPCHCERAAAGGAIDLTDSPALNHHIEILGGVLAQDCGAVSQQFFRNHRS